MMLAMRLLSAARGEVSEEHDSRTVESVLVAAAKRLGEPYLPAASCRLEVNGVKWAWQMAQFSDSDWDQLGLSLGLKAAAKAELAEPSDTPPESAQKYKAHQDLTGRMRRFLLLPEADGKEPKPLGEMSAIFLGLLSTPVADRQSLLLALCELMALVSGLFLSTPFDLRSGRTPLSEVAAAGSIWAVPPTLADGMDALVAFIFLMNFHVATFAVTLALYVAASGNQADDTFCEGIMSVLGVCFAFFVLGVFFPLLVLCFWQFFTDAASPYPMLANVVVTLLFHHIVGARTQRFLAEAMALELYHGPTWLLRLLRAASHGMGTTHLIAERPLKAAAELRAAKLRAEMMVLDANGNALAGTRSRTSPTPAAAPGSPEARARRHLRIVAMES